MISKIKKPVSILLSLIMVFSVFTIVPFTAHADPVGFDTGGNFNDEVGSGTTGGTIGGGSIIGSATSSFVKVTEEPDDWSGDYLIVYEDEDDSKAFNGSADSLDSSDNDIDVTISNGEIELDDDTDAAKVTIAAIDGGYSIAAADDYIGGLSNYSNGINIQSDAILTTISLDDDDYADIVSNSKYFRYNTNWNGGNGFRYFRTKSQKSVCLYKLTSSAPAGPVDPTANEPTGLTATYGQRLADVSLTNPAGNTAGTWMWLNPSTSVGNVGSRAFPARFIPNDTSSYNTVQKNVTVTVEKANPTANEPTGLTATYGQRLADVSLTNPAGNTPGTWSWDSPSTSVGEAGSHTFLANFTPSDTTNYKTVQKNLTVTVSVPTYTITWNNWDDTELEKDTGVAEGANPEYNGETPTKDGVTFAGWTDSHGVFYAKDATLPEVTADETYTAVFELTIGSVDEWNSFAASVKGGNTYSGIIVRMTADVGPVTTMVDGTFSGTFDGDGHTLTVNISGGSTTAATFAYVKDATIQNLRLEGTVTSSGIHTAALVKSVSDTGSTCTIKNVDIYADVNCSNNYIGGFIGHAGTANTVNIENSIFAGSINKTGSTQGNFIGAFIGWSQTLTATINNCAFTGSYNNIKSFNNIGFSYNAPTKVTVSGFYSNASEVFVANVNHGTRLYVPSSSYPTSVALVKNNDGETFYSAFSDALNAWVDGSTLALLADVTCDSMISVPANTSKILDLNGKTLTTIATNTVYGTLTIQSTVSGGNIIHTNKSQVISVQEEATLNINSGTIHGYNADRAVIGGGEGGTYNLNGGKIVTSASNAFSIGSGSTLNLNGGEIECTSGSTSMGTASAVWAHGDSTINWNGTAITTNTGDGIRMKSAGNGTVNVTGGSFTATSSSLPEEGGYAIYCNSNMGTLNLEGNPSISGRGIYLADDKVINITNDLSNTNPISVTMQTPGVFTSGLSGNGDASNFANGNGTGYALTLNASGEAQIVSTYTITWKNGDTVLETDTDVAEGATPTYDGTTPYKADGANCIYTFSGWTPEVSAVTGDATYTAQFTATEKPEVIKDCNNKYGNFRLYSNVPIVQFSNSDALLTGAIIPITYGDNNSMIPLVDAKGYSYKLYDQTGTEIPFEITSSESEPGSGYGFSDDVTVYTNVINFTRPAGCTAIYIVATEPAPAPAPAKLILNVGENGKVVMDNGTFGNATDASNIDDIAAPFNVTDGSKLFIVDGRSANLVEGGSINIATGGEFSFYPSADNTGVITAIPDEGYVCIGWYNGDTLYSSDATLAYQTISEDMTLTAKFAPELAPKHSISLKGNVALNFYMNTDLVHENDVVTFTHSGKTDTYTVTAADLVEGKGYKAPIELPAAEMTVDVTVSVNGVAQTDTYSVRDYCDEILSAQYAASYQAPADKQWQTYENLVALVKTMLDYGAKAQSVFSVNTADLANDEIGYTMPDKTDAEMIALIDAAIAAANSNQTADDPSDFEDALSAKYYTTSLIFLSESTLRHYFTPTTWPGEMINANLYDGCLGDTEYYYYVEKTDIAAAQLDTLQTFTIGETTFKYSALDYVKALLASENMTAPQKALAAATYWYNQAANTFFDPAA